MRIKRALGFDPTMQRVKKLQSIYGPLSTASRASCDEYAVEVLGNKSHASWLYVYTLLAGEFKSGWIPHSYYGAVVLGSTGGDYGNVSELKAYQPHLFKETFPDILYSVNRRLWDSKFSLIANQEAKEVLFRNSEKVVFKADLSKQGRGVVVLSANEVNETTWGQLGNGVYQAYIKPYPIFENFHPGSVATLRMTTVVDNLGEVSLRGCYLRFGVGNDTHVRSATHVKVGVDLVSGELSEVGYDGSWAQIETHPDSGKAFAGTQIPNFKLFLETVKKLHKVVPFVQCIGWDLAVNQEGYPALLEWNGGFNGLLFEEAVQGPCFADLGWENLWLEKQ